MANWFKLYETDLDETRMRYALTKVPEAWPVWTALLMECCKHRSGSLKWGTTEQELFGFSDRLKISIPKVNLAINILCEINYVRNDTDSLKILKWSEKQGDYISRAGYWKSRRKNKKNVTVNHSDARCVHSLHSESHIEERRGEEIRKEESKEGDFSEAETKARKLGVSPLLIPIKPTIEETKLYCAKAGISEPDAEWFWNKCEGNGWTNGGQKIKSWRHTLTSWKTAGYLPSQKSKQAVRPVGGNF